MVSPTLENAQAEKICPYCGEQIKAVAIVCRFCGMNLETGASTRLAGPVIARPVPAAMPAAPAPEVTCWQGRTAIAARLIAVAGWLLASGIFLSFLLAAAARNREVLLSAALPVLFLACMILRSIGRVVNALCSSFVVTSRRVRCAHGMFGTTSSEMGVEDIRNVVVTRGLLDRLLGIGSVGIAGSTASQFEVRFVGIRRPQEVRDLVIRAKEQARLALGSR